MIRQQASPQGLSARRLCALVRLPRAGLYRTPRRPSAGEMDLRDALQKVALDNPAYGVPRVTAQLRRQGWQLGPKRVRRMMREDNLLCQRHRRFRPVTTDSDHPLPVYRNLVSELEPTAPNQLWVADITYIRLVWEFIYLAVLLDAYSRKAIGWALGRSLAAELPLAALEQALRERVIEPGLIHHSDRGSQYASQQYIARLEAHGIRVSMSRKGNPYDNAQAESFLKTLKVEEVYLNEYQTFEQAAADLGHFIAVVYNQRRLHSALGYVPPAEFEAAWASGPAAAAVEAGAA